MKRKIIYICLLLLAFSVNLRAQDACAVTERTPSIVSAEWLAEHLGHENLVILHIGEKAGYDAGHIPTARYISTRDISLPPEESGGLALQLPKAETLKTAFEKLGVGNSSRIVLYFGKDWVTPTTRVYFTLDYLGLKNNTSILDGGMPAWTALGKSLTKEIPNVKPGSLKIAAHDEFVASADWINSKLNDASVKIVDARAPNFYDGTTAGGYPRPGRIAGAKNIPFSSVVDETNKLKPESELRKLFEAAGVKPYDTVVTYCHIGQQASLVYFAARSLGYKTKLYDGSFEQWSANADLPVDDPQAATRGTRVSIVTPQWVAENTAAENLRVIDARLNVYDYFAAHIPNAVHLADAALRAPRDGYPTQYLELFMSGRLFSQAGIKKGDRVVVYSDGDGVLGATMIVYLLERLGHGEIMFVDGGFRDYKAAHRTAQEYPVYKAGAFDALDNKAVSADLETVKTAIGREGVKFIDARPPDVYRGETKIWTRNGHIPGAVNVPWKTLVEENNAHKFKPVDEMRKVFADRGIKETDDIIVYCGTSREASLEYLVLKHVLKFPKVRLYEGSWAEYSNHPQMKIETGAGS